MTSGEAGDSGKERVLGSCPEAPFPHDIETTSPVGVRWAPMHGCSKGRRLPLGVHGSLCAWYVRRGHASGLPCSLSCALVLASTPRASALGERIVSHCIAHLFSRSSSRRFSGPPWQRVVTMSRRCKCCSMRWCRLTRWTSRLQWRVARRPASPPSFPLALARVPSTSKDTNSVAEVEGGFSRSWIGVVAPRGGAD